MMMLDLAAGAGFGALATLIVTWWLNRNTATREARRETYLELLAMLKAALRVQQTAIFDPDAPIPDVISDDRIDAFNALLEIDCSPEVRDLASKAFGLASRFNVSHGTSTPIDVDGHGIYHHRFDLVRGVDDESAALQMRLALGKIYDELKVVVDQPALRVRREVHGFGG